MKIFLSFFSVLLAGLSLQAAPSLLINFSNSGANDITAQEAADFGTDTYTNVRTGTVSSAGTTASIDLDGVTGSATYSDYFQSNQKSRLGQPYATLIGAAEIGSTGKSVDISLDLDSWLTNNDVSTYQVTLYYAGRSVSSELLMTDASPDVFFNGSKSDIVFVTDRNSGYWKGHGQTHAFTADDSAIGIHMDYLGSGQEAGICAIRIDAVVQPVGLWLFDDESDIAKATIGDDLEIVGTSPAWDDSVTDSQPAPALLQGVITTRHGPANYLKAFHDIGANGGGTLTNQYTLVFDFMVPDTDDEWRAFYQTNKSNNNDAEFFVHKTNKTLGLGTINYSTQKIDQQRWYRLAITVDLSSEGFLRS